VINKYVDKYGLYHDKPCIDGLPSSGNPAIYTAYAIQFGLIPSWNFKAVYDQLITINPLSKTFKLDRSLDMDTTLSSIDEMIGWVEIGCLTAKFLKHHNWRYYDQNHKPVWWRQLKAVIYLAGEHRNYVQDQNVRDAHPIVFLIGPQFRYYINKRWGEKATKLQWLAFQLHCMSTILHKNTSDLNILLLMLRRVKSKYWIKLVKRKKNFADRFPLDHPFNNN